MGKMKQKRFKQQKAEPTGLPSVREFEAQAELEMSAGGGSRVSGTVSSAVEKLQSPSQEERECACLTINSLASQPGIIPELIRGDLIKHMAPLMLDPTQSVRLAALGALRNVSVDGGPQVCDTMVRQDIMTPLVTLLKQYGAKWVPENVSKSVKDQELKLNTYLQAIHLMWNICESCEVAVKIFNQQEMLLEILPCLQRDVYGTEMAIAVGQLLYTVTEDNKEAACTLGQQSVLSGLQLLVTTQHQSTDQLLLRILSAGILYNVMGGSLRSAAGSMVASIVNVLAEVLQQDLSDQLHNIAAMIKQIAESCTTPENSESNSMTKELKEIQHKSLETSIQSVDQLLSSQQLALELVANLCCSDEGSEEDEWEDISDSDANSEDPGVPDQHMEDACSNTLSPLCVPTEVHGAFVSAAIVNKVLCKCDSPDQTLQERLSSHVKGRRIVNSLQSVQVRALICINNLASSLEVEALGGPEVLHDVWANLSQLTISKQVVENNELLEAATGAMRAVAQKLLEINSPKLAEVTSADLQFLYEMGHQCQHAGVCANIVRVISIVGCVLAKQSIISPLLKDIGIFLLVIASKDMELWVVAEALDALFDVFAEDNTDPIVADIGLLGKLKALSPVLKTKIQQQRKTLGNHKPIISTARENLVRFIKYKSKPH